MPPTGDPSPALPAPAHIYQLDGSPWAGFACMGAAGAMALDAYTRGALSGVTEHQIRAFQTDQSGGIGLNDVQAAWKKGWGLNFWQGSPTWTAIAARLAKRQGVVIACTYGLMGSYRAPGSRFAGAHAIYLQGFATPSADRPASERWIVLDDPLRQSSSAMPESVVRRAWSGGAGWGAGVYGGPPARSSDLIGAFYQSGAPLVSYPKGSTSWTADAIMAVLRQHNYFTGDPASATIADQLVAGILAQSAGQPWTDALIATWAAKLGTAANLAGTTFDPTGGAAAGILAALTDLPTTLARGGIVAGLVALGVLGVALTFREPLVAAVRPLAKGALLA